MLPRRAECPQCCHRIADATRAEACGDAAADGHERRTAVRPYGAVI